MPRRQVAEFEQWVAAKEHKRKSRVCTCGEWRAGDGAHNRHCAEWAAQAETRLWRAQDER